MNKNKDKKNNKELEEPQEVKKEETCEKAKEFKKEIESLKKELSSEQEKVKNLQHEVQTLKLTIQKADSDYVSKLQEKQLEMKKILEEKQKELTILNDEKLNDFKHKLYTKDILEMLNTIDRFEAILRYESPDPTIQNYINGFKMFLDMFQRSLNNMGITKVEIPLGSEPDHNNAEITDQVDNSNHKSGTVCEVTENAYSFNNKIIKHAKVKVSK